MKLLVATDNAFFRTPDGVFDSFCFDRAFFDDYRAVFDEVIVAARMSREAPPPHAHRSDGDGVRFIDLANVHGAKWALAPMRWYCGALPAAVADADAVCVRIPSVSGVYVARLASRCGKPVMFELIGDPLVQIGAFGFRGKLFGARLARQTRHLVARSVVGSYVSRVHLQQRYPASTTTRTDSISSIRLYGSDFCPSRVFRQPPDPLRVVLVASMHPYKDHATLIRAAASLRERDVPIRVNLVGDGSRRAALESLVSQLGLQDCVVFHGHVAGRGNVNHCLDESDLFVMPSVGEGLPRAMIEAMSRGLPAVGADSAAMRELLPTEQLFRVRDHESLALLLETARQDASLLTRWAEYSARMSREFSNERLAAKRQRLLRSLMEAASGRGGRGR